MTNARKKKICLVTNWYPDKENPYRGSFFKEQAFAMSEYFDFIVVHYVEKKRTPLLVYLFRAITGKVCLVEKTNIERNTEEYNISVYFPLYTTLVDKVYDLYLQYIKRVSVEGIGEYVSGCYKKKKYKYIKKIFTESLTEDFDILYCVDAQAESYTLQIISEITGKPYVVSEHAPFPWPGSSLKDVEHEAIKNADLFLAISYDKIRQVLLQNINLKKIAYVGNLVDEEKFVLAHNEHKVRTFVMVAAHSFYKNYPLFIDVFERLTELTTYPFKVMIVGYGANKGYSKNAKLLEEKIRNSKFAQYVELIPEVSRDKIHEIYAEADAFVMTSIQEGMPVSALEAGCCGLPIFSTMCGGVEDYVDEKMGRIYKIVDSESFAKGLKDYLEGKIQFDSEYIRTRVVEKYGKNAFVERICKEIGSLIE